MIAADNALFLKGRFESEGDALSRILVSDIQFIEELRERNVTGIVISAAVEELPLDAAPSLMSLFQQNEGDCGVVFELRQGLLRCVRIESDQIVRVKPTSDLVREIEKICGKGAVQLTH